MTNTTTKPDSVQPAAAAAVDLFDDWFDPIESGLRDRVRDFIHGMIEGELDMVLARPRCARHGKPPGAEAEGAADRREEALEAEVGEALGRECHERAEGAPSGYRNGVRTGRLATAEGMLEYSAPQLRQTPEPFVSAIRGSLKGRTQALENLAVELYARGLSTRDIEKAFMG